VRIVPPWQKFFSEIEYKLICRYWLVLVTLRHEYRCLFVDGNQPATMLRLSNLDPAEFPVSSRGSWLSLAVRDARHAESHRPMGKGLYLRNHHGFQLNSREVVKVDLLRDGRHCAARYGIRPGELSLRPEKGGGGEVRLLVTGRDGLRIQSKGGLGLRLTGLPSPGNIAYRLDETRCTLNLRSARMRLQVNCLEGRQILDAPWVEDQCRHLRVRLLPCPDKGGGEWAIDRFTSTWKRPRRLSFAGEAERLKRSFETFLAKQNPVTRPFEETRRLAALANWSCLVSPCGKFRHEAMLMSKGWMDQVWSWDNCFNAMALATSDTGLALAQLETVIERQDEDGVYPDAMNDVHEHYCFSKPPVWGIALRYLREKNPRAFNVHRLARIHHSVVRFTDWWLSERRLPGHRLCHYLHGNDSGWDNSTQFDQGVPLEAPDLNAFLILQLDVLAGMARELGQNKTASRLESSRDELLEALVSELWNGDRFTGLRDGLPVQSESLIPCMPIVLGHMLPGSVLRRLVARIRLHLTRWGLATELPTSEMYVADGYWRGPIWGPSTVLIWEGLRRLGEHRLASSIARRYFRLCRASGFAENFDALTGRPLRDPCYTWTSSAFLILAADQVSG